jgi:hypothetical protein
MEIFRILNQKAKSVKRETILSTEESKQLFNYLKDLEIPVNEYVHQYFDVDDFFDSNEK